jgi:excinuclease ABC subunit A
LAEVITTIEVRGACEHNLKNVDVSIGRKQITVITGVSGSGKSSLVFDTILAESQRRFFYTLSQYSRQFLDLGSRPSVKTVSGLSPAISLSQNETQPSKRASVGTLTDIAELIGVLFANYSVKSCPKHQTETSAISVELFATHVIDDLSGQTIAVCAPVAEDKKGAFKKQLTTFANKGYVRAFIDGSMVPLSPVPSLDKDKKHTIKVLIDLIKVKDSSRDRLCRGIKTSTEESSGYAEIYQIDQNKKIDTASFKSFSRSGGCPKCGFSWPKIDPRFFSANSLGKCLGCQGYGMAEDDEYGFQKTCTSCLGTGLNNQYDAIKVGGHSVSEVHQMSIESLKKWIDSLLNSSLKSNPAFSVVADHISKKSTRLVEVELGYLQLSRRVHTLSGGESQRLKLASILAESLRGVMYILDEPSQGLHPTELEVIWKTLQRLKTLGNTVIVVDHDEYFIRHADKVIDMGPGGGQRGGMIQAIFNPKEAADYVEQSLTAKHLIKHLNDRKLAQKGIQKKSKEKHRAGQFSILNAAAHNLKIDRVDFLFESLNIVSGVSGAGKSTLIKSVFYQNMIRYLALNKKLRSSKLSLDTIEWVGCEGIEGIEKVVKVSLVDRKPIAKSSISMPVTYLDIFTDIRKIYEKLPDTQIAGLNAKSFSLFSEGGRCEECKGRGEIVLSMRFLSDSRVKCPVCLGQRYKENVLLIKYNSQSIADVLSLTLDQAFEHFKNHKKISRKLKPAIDLGLGYLKMGQTSASLSGGEAQRLKMVPHMSKFYEPSSIVLIDEPTQGLHFSDVELLLNALKKMVENGLTVILIEHNPDVILQADWVVDLGPESSSNGGKVVYQGTPFGLMKAVGSKTALYLQKNLT